MTTMPSMFSEIREQQAEVHDALLLDVQTAVDIFMERLADIAWEYRW
jgi:antitoxin component of RelBE/YafQ-DinJ toxin-antitoxin module